jgi:hypothetical protein
MVGRARAPWVSMEWSNSCIAEDNNMGKTHILSPLPSNEPASICTASPAPPFAVPISAMRLEPIPQV